MQTQVKATNVSFLVSVYIPNGGNLGRQKFGRLLAKLQSETLALLNFKLSNYYYFSWYKKLASKT